MRSGGCAINTDNYEGKRPADPPDRSWEMTENQYGPAVCHRRGLNDRVVSESAAKCAGDCYRRKAFHTEVSAGLFHRMTFLCCYSTGRTVSRQIWRWICAGRSKPIHDGIGRSKNPIQGDMAAVRQAHRQRLKRPIRCIPVKREWKNVLRRDGQITDTALLPYGYMNMASPRGFEPLLPP